MDILHAIVVLFYMTVAIGLLGALMAALAWLAVMGFWLVAFCAGWLLTEFDLQSRPRWVELEKKEHKE